jgi:cell division transport system ATP-binding protein
MKTLLRLAAAECRFPGGFRLAPVTLELDPGELMLITGPSGAGKTTLLKIMTLEIPLQGGRRFFRDVDLTRPTPRQLARYRRETGIVRQEVTLLPERTIMENLQFRYYVLGTWNGRVRRDLYRLLGYFHLQHRTQALPRELSAGERQRAELACAFAGHPAVIFADEPLAHLDHEHKEDVLEMMRFITSYGTAVVMATHDPLARELPGVRLLKIREGEVR